MSLSLGHLVGYLELDDKKFNRSAAAADKKMTALQLHLKALAATNPKIQVDVETKKLDDLKAKMADLKAQAAKGVDVRVEVAAALIEIDRVQNKLRMLHNQEVRIRVDNRSALASIGQVGSKINGLWATILGLGPMLIPIGAAATGSILAIGSASLSAAAGVGVLAAAFAGIGKSAQALATYREAVKQAGPKAALQVRQLAVGVEAAQHNFAKHPTALNAHRLSIAKQKQGMGPASLTAARDAFDKSEYGDQSAAGKRFVKFSLDTLGPATHGLHNTAQTAVLPGVERGLRSMLPLLPVFNKLVDNVGRSLGTMAARTGKALNDPFWRHFFNWLATTAGPNLLVMGHSWGQLFEGIFRTLERFGPQGHSFIMWVDGLTTKFNAWSKGGAGSGFESFMAYVQESGPAVVAVLKPLGQIVGELLTGMASSGLGELHVFATLLDGIAHLPTGAIETIGVVLPGIILALKGMQFVNALSGGINGLAGSFGNLARNAEGAAATGSLGGGKTAGRVGGVITGLSIVAAGSGVHNKKGQYAANIGGGALAGGSAGAALGSVIPGVGTGAGAAIGATIGGLAGLYKQLHQVNSETKKSGKSWQDYTLTLDGVHAAAGLATRQMAYQRIEASGLFDATRKLGLSDREVVQAVTGHTAARKKLGEALASEQRTHLAGLSPEIIQNIYDETSAVGKARLAQLQMNLAVAQTKEQVRAAQRALDAFSKTDGTAKVGLTGYKKMRDELWTLKRLYDGLTGGTSSGSGGSIPAPATGLGGLLGDPGADTQTGGHRPAGQLPKGPHRALGGPVTAGITYKINERGPETFFTPGRNGTILDAHGTQEMLKRGSGGGVTSDDIHALITSIRPVYGDVHISGDPTVFRREMQHDQRRAALSGVQAG